MMTFTMIIAIHFELSRAIGFDFIASIRLILSTKRQLVLGRISANIIISLSFTLLTQLSECEWANLEMNFRATLPRSAAANFRNASGQHIMESRPPNPKRIFFGIFHLRK